MVLLTFTVKKDKLLSGAKRRSMRRQSIQWNRLYEKIKSGKKSKLNIYYKSMEKLFDADVVGMEKVNLKDLTEEQAKLDGFESLKECREWFTKGYKLKTLDFPMYIIKFKPIKIFKEKEKLNIICFNCPNDDEPDMKFIGSFDGTARFECPKCDNIILIQTNIRDSKILDVLFGEGY